jgi:hypothetical protein
VKLGYELRDRPAGQQQSGHNKQRQPDELAGYDAVGAEERGDGYAQHDSAGSGCQVRNQGAAPADAAPQSEQKQTCQDRAARLGRSSDVHADPVKKPRREQQDTREILPSCHCHAGRLGVPSTRGQGANSPAGQQNAGGCYAPRTATVTEIAGAMITPQWDGGRAELLIEAPELDLTLRADGQDLFAALQQLRKSLEPLGWFPLCNGARLDC